MSGNWEQGFDIFWMRYCEDVGLVQPTDGHEETARAAYAAAYQAGRESAKTRVRELEAALRDDGHKAGRYCDVNGRPDQVGVCIACLLLTSHTSQEART